MDLSIWCGLCQLKLKLIQKESFYFWKPIFVGLNRFVRVTQKVSNSLKLSHKCHFHCKRLHDLEELFSNFSWFDHHFQNLAFRPPSLCLPNSSRLSYSYHPLFYLPSPTCHSTHTLSRFDVCNMGLNVCWLGDIERISWKLEVQTRFYCNCFSSKTSGAIKWLTVFLPSLTSITCITLKIK